MTDLFTDADIISTYTRANAIEDGVQIDVTDNSGSDVYKTAVFVTSALWAEITRGAGKDAETATARLWDCCYMTAKCGQKISQIARRSRVKVGRRTLTVHAECGPTDIDDPAPAITLGLPEDF